MRIVLDTSAFFKPAALAELRNAPDDVIVPAVSLAERVRQLRRDGRDETVFFRGLDESGFVSEALSPEAACAVARGITDDATWRKHARDALIAAHVGPADRLWTSNPKDFVLVGVKPEQIVTLA